MPSLEDAINAAGGPLALLRGGSGGFPLPIKSEFTNWRDEQESWRTTAALMDLSHHMSDLTVEGPDTYRLLADLGANSFKGFGPMKAKQFVPVSYDGYMIGDCILFCLAENHVRLVGRPPALNWVQFHAETGSYDVTVRLDPRTANNPKGQRELFRLQLQGPFAAEIFEKVNGGPMPAIPFFHMGKFNVGKHEVTALNHRMSGFPGLEFFGPVRGVRGRAGHAARGRRRVRPAPGRRPRLRVGGDRVRLGRQHRARGLHRGEDEGVPRVAAGTRLRGEPGTGRQLRARAGRGPLRHALGPRLRQGRQVRPRVHRPRGARAPGRRSRTGRRSGCSGTATTSPRSSPACTSRATSGSSTSRCRPRSTAARTSTGSRSTGG